MDPTARRQVLVDDVDHRKDRDRNAECERNGQQPTCEAGPPRRKQHRDSERRTKGTEVLGVVDQGRVTAGQHSGQRDDQLDCTQNRQADAGGLVRPLRHVAAACRSSGRDVGNRLADAHQREHSEHCPR